MNRRGLFQGIAGGVVGVIAGLTSQAHPASFGVVTEVEAIEVETEIEVIDGIWPATYIGEHTISQLPNGQVIINYVYVDATDVGLAAIADHIAAYPARSL